MLNLYDRRDVNFKSFGWFSFDKICKQSKRSIKGFTLLDQELIFLFLKKISRT